MDIQPNQSGVIPRFYLKPVEVKWKSEQEGRPIFQDKEYVEIHIAGDSKTVVNRKVQDADKQRWPDHYQAFQRGQEAPIEGTRLEHWPALSPSKVSELKGLNILTVEALAELPDSLLSRLGMGSRALQAKAKAFLSAATDTAEVQRLAAENERLKQEIEFLKQQVKELGSAPKETPAEDDEESDESSDEEPANDLAALGLSTRTLTALQKADITTVDQLKAMAPDDFLAIPGIGQGALDEIIKVFD